uniref:HAT family dimerisation domain containing protein n=1 Tax=Oryza sativa subsp. japonica TaxID=39947 RepID=Q7XE06_ORYSJ|nr:hAT family dimerisation domain containing protein [Oryza sativa Japonica Group]
MAGGKRWKSAWDSPGRRCGDGTGQCGGGGGGGGDWLRRGERAMSNPAATVESQVALTPSSTPTPTNAPSVEINDSQGTEVEHDNKRLKSAAWQDFVKKKINGAWKAECKWCHNKLGAESRNGTKHLLDHIKTCKSRQARKGLTQSNLKMGIDAEGRVTVGKYVFDQEVARKELALMICLHEYPLSIVDHVGFRRFCGALQPLFKVMTRNTIRKDIIDLFGVNKISISNYFHKLQSRVAITTDLWTATHQKKGYMAITAHFIDDEWKLKSFLLRFIYVPAPHTADLISEIIYEVLADWNLESRLSTITLDNCSTNDKLMENLLGTMLDKLPADTLMLNGSLLHMRCCAHILNLIVKDGMTILDKIIEKVRESVSFWTATPKRHEKFEKQAQQINVKYEKVIALDCKTRWNSTYLMLSTAVLYQDVFTKLGTREKMYTPYCPSNDDWKFARELCDRLKIFYDATEAFSGTKYEKYWKDVHGILAIASVLDPRYKLHMLNAMFIQIYGEEVALRKVNAVKEDLNKLVLQYQNHVEEGVGTSDGVSASSSVAPPGGFDLVDDIFDQYMSGQTVASSSQIRTELDLYLEEKPLPRTQDFDIINWWKFGGIRYPTLRQIARDILAIPITTVASESAFSTGGRVITPNRNQLKPDLVEALMCVQAWGRADMLAEIANKTNALNTVLDDESESEASTVTEA